MTEGTEGINLNRSYAEHIMNEKQWYKEYDTYWSNGGTYGTCWDEDGPSDVHPDCPETIYDVSMFMTIINNFYPDAKPNTEFTMNCEVVVNEWTDGEGDYYGGYEEKGHIGFQTKDLVEFLLRRKHKMNSCSLGEAYEMFPELFL